MRVHRNWTAYVEPDVLGVTWPDTLTGDWPGASTIRQNVLTVSFYQRPGDDKPYIGGSPEASGYRVLKSGETGTQIFDAHFYGELPGWVKTAVDFATAQVEQEAGWIEMGYNVAG